MSERVSLGAKHGTDADANVTITADLVAALIAEQFPHWRSWPVTAVDPCGWDNRTFRLGNDMVVRLPSHSRYVAQVEKEQRWLPVLAPELPLPIPVPVAEGKPNKDYPWSWSIYRWLDGDPAQRDNIVDFEVFAADLANFLCALHGIDPAGGPPPGEHNFFRGGPLVTYDQEVREALVVLADRINVAAATAVWAAALGSAWDRPGVWVHGDVAASNLLVRGGHLAGVIDFGCAGVGDPACDLTIAWTLFDRVARQAFRKAMMPDDDTWSRARGWALWKALVLLWHRRDSTSTQDAQHVLAELLAAESH